MPESMVDHLIVGCGYLGTRVAQRWARQGHRVFATARRPEHAQELASLGLVPIVADVLAPESLRALPAAAVVLYCVGYDRSAGVPMRTVYVDGLANFLAALPPGGRLVHVSSTSVYGQTEGEEVDENATTEPADESGRVVLDAEQVLRRLRPDAIVLRFAGTYGPGRLIGARALQKGEAIPGDPERWLNLIHVEDGATACERAAQRGVPGAIYNVSDDTPVRRGDAYSIVAELLGLPPPRFDLDASAPRHEASNRRILNRRMHNELSVSLRYPSCKEGMAACLPTTA